MPTTRYIPAFALTRSAAAYWRGSEKNPQLQRIYGTAWEIRGGAAGVPATGSPRPRRATTAGSGTELDLFSFPDEIGSGLAVFHPKGGIIRKEMEDYSPQRHVEAGYEFVNTPHITKAQLFEISGHLDWYADGMFPPMHLDAELGPDGEVRKPGQNYYLKPMNCPMHNLIFRSRGPVLPRAAVADVRVRHRLPVREVRRHPRSHPGPRDDPGRCAHLLHPRADAPTS